MWPNKTCVLYNYLTSVTKWIYSNKQINLDGDLLIFGGYNGYRREHMNDLWLLETSSWTWSEIKPSGYGPDPRRRQNMQRVVFKNSVIL